jgi:transposase
MAMGRRSSNRQEQFWVAVADIPKSPGHPFYLKLNQLLAESEFDPFVEDLCQPFYHVRLGRPSVPPGTYFRMLLIGYFEGIGSERGIAWRSDDSRTLRQFLGYSIEETTPDHSTLSNTRERIDLETHQEVFCWVLKMLSERDLLRGESVGIDATTLEANAAMRSIVRRGTGESYNEFLTSLAKESGIPTPTRQDLARIDRSRKRKASNKDWQDPYEPDAKITKMKDGSTHLAHKAEHAVDFQSGAIVAVTLQPADRGDTESLPVTLEQTQENLKEAAGESENVQSPEGQGRGGEEAAPDEQRIVEVVADKGYHSNQTCRDLSEAHIRSYFSEPDNGRRNWKGKGKERQAVYANRRRIRGERGKGLLRKRGELLERSFAHCYETGGMRRIHLRGHPNILKRLLIHVAGFNLALVMRSMYGIGKPRRLQDGLPGAVLGLLGGILAVSDMLRRHLGLPGHLGVHPAAVRVPVATRR